jgi:hypothetical protein
MNSDSLRRPLSLMPDGTAPRLREEVMSALREAVALLNGLIDDPDEFVAGFVSGRRRVSRGRPIGPFELVEAADRLADGAEVRVRDGIHLLLAESADGCRVEVGPTSIDFPIHAAAILRTLAEHRCYRVGSATHRSPGQDLAVIRELMLKGALSPAVGLPATGGS